MWSLLYGEIPNWRRSCCPGGRELGLLFGELCSIPGFPLKLCKVQKQEKPSLASTAHVMGMPMPQLILGSLLGVCPPCAFLVL